MAHADALTWTHPIVRDEADAANKRITGALGISNAQPESGGERDGDIERAS